MQIHSPVKELWLLQKLQKDFEVVKNKIRHQTILRILWYVFQASFATIGKSKVAGEDHIQFVVDKDHKNPKFLSTGYLASKEISLTVNETELETGMTQKFAEKKEYSYLYGFSEHCSGWSSYYGSCYN